MVLPKMPGANPRLLIAAGKAGNMYLLDATRIHNVNRLATYPIGPCWCGPSFYQGADGIYRVVSSGGSSVIIWDLATSDSAPAALTQERAVPITSGQDGGFFTSVSSNGVQPGTAIIWAVGRRTSIPGARPCTRSTRSATPSCCRRRPEAGSTAAATRISFRPFRTATSMSATTGSCKSSACRPPRRRLPQSPRARQPARSRRRPPPRQ